MSDITEFRAPTGMDQASLSSQGYGMVQYGPTDDKLIVGFYKESRLHSAKSREEGRPVYESADFVQIQHPGENLNIVKRPVMDSDKQRWPRQWSQFVQGTSQIPEGVPLSLLFPSRPHIVATLRGYNIHTVEQLSRLSGEAISTVGMGAQEWVNLADRYMEQADKGVNHHQFEKAMADKEAQIVALQRQVAEVTALVRSQQSSTQAPPASFDAQTAQINATHQSVDMPFTPQPAQFVRDLSNSVEPPRRRGRPPGIKNKPKEI